jgi:hypothetical protein
MEEQSNEIWKKIDGYDHYSVSSFGNVRNDRTGRILKASINNYGYSNVKFCKDKKRKLYKVHRLVVIAFIENPGNKLCVDLIDNSRLTNHVSNIRWTTKKRMV